MCGINGFAVTDLARSLGAPFDLALLERMNQRSFHRGPDDGGVADLGFAALGMRRLSIQDIAGGRQPMQSDDGRFTLVYNGELYDVDGLRRELEAKGHRFKTRSDTEVLLEAWIENREACLPELNGMFAFAVADRRERTLWLARDTVGIKPLYYWLGASGELVFSSELSSLLVHPSVPRRLDHDALAQLLVDRYVADPWTLLEGVRQLSPGHMLCWRDGDVRIGQFAELGLSQPRTFASDREAIEELQGVLETTVRSQLVADVPVGVFLSGGIDSSTVAAYAARSTEGPLKSFSVGFARKSYDESPLAREVAAQLGTEHHEIRVEDARFEVGMLDTLLDHLGQPMADTSAIPTWIVSKLAAEHVKVVLSGDGGDEFFGGYDHMFWAARVRRVSERAPSILRRAGSAVLAGVAPHAPATWADRARRARKGLELTFLDPDEQFRDMRSLWSASELNGVLSKESAARNLRESYPGDFARLESLPVEEAAMAVLARTYLPGAILPKVDRMSMAASLEVRVPLLDERVIDCALSMPLGMKIRGKVGKHVLREAGRAMLPASVYSHKKQGFSIPLFDWFNAEFWELAHSLYTPNSRAAALFRPGVVQEVLAGARAAQARPGVVSETSAATRAWMLVMVARWLERLEVSL